MSPVAVRYATYVVRHECAETDYWRTGFEDPTALSKCPDPSEQYKATRRRSSASLSATRTNSENGTDEADRPRQTPDLPVARYHDPSVTAWLLAPPIPITVFGSTGTNGLSLTPSFSPTVFTFAKVVDAARSLVSAS